LIQYSYTWGIALYDHYAILASYYHGLTIVDIANPASPRLVASVPGYAHNVVVHGTYAYGLGLGLTIIDIADPTRPRRIDDASFQRVSTDLRVQGRYAYVAVEGGLSVIDLVKPAHPQEVTFYAMAFRPFNQIAPLHLDLAEGQLYVVTERDGLFVFRVR
jgi:hypothetical protein